MPKPNVAELVECATEAGRIEDPVQFGGIALHTQYPPEHLGRAAAVVLPIPVRPVDLVVVVGDPAIMDSEQFGPALGLGEAPVGHAPLHIEVAFDVALPRLALLDLFLVNAECGIDCQRPRGFENTPAVAHQRFRTAVLADRGIEHHQIRREILRAGEHTPEDHSAVVLQDGDDMDHPAAEPMHVDVAHIHCPVLVPAAGFDTSTWPKPAPSPCGLDFRGQPNGSGGSASGGDIDLAIAPRRNQAGTFTLYVSSLNGGSVTVAHSTDDGTSFSSVPVQAGLPADDRPWIAAFDSATSILTFTDQATADRPFRLVAAPGESPTAHGPVCCSVTRAAAAVQLGGNSAQAPGSAR